MRGAVGLSLTCHIFPAAGSADYSVVGGLLHGRFI